MWCSTWAAFFVVLASFGSLECSHFRGSYITWIVNQTDYGFYPANPYSQMAKVHVRYGTAWRRSDGSSMCTNSSIANCQFFNHGSWSVYYGYSEATQPYYHSSFSAGFFCEKFSVAKDLTIGSNKLTIYLPKTYTYKARTSSCCWIGGMAVYSSSSWNVEAVISLKKRSPYLANSANKINTPPQIDHVPLIQHDYYNTRSYALPVSDPDGDQVRCRWAANFTEGGGVWNYQVGTLSQNCVLTLYSAYFGWYPVTIMVEDYAYSWLTYRWERQSSVPVQFTVLVMAYYYNHPSIRAPIVVHGGNQTHCDKNISLTIKSVVVPPASSPAYPAASSYQPVPPVLMTQSVNMSKVQSLDGCRYYQVLSEADRGATYNDWSQYRCDQELYGWYRFMGQAGNRMSNSCPNSGSYSYKCGSYYQGWIPSGALPTVYQGIVSRSVCFSRYGYCSCSYYKSIMIKNCGTFHVYWLDGVPACNSRYCSVKDKSSTVSCSTNYMRIDLDRSYFDASLYSSITLRNPSCSATTTSLYITLGSVPGACGSIRKETSTHIVFENEVVFTAKTSNGIISRDLDQKVTFQCLYNKNGQVSSGGYRPMSSVNATETGYGNFSFNFVMYKDRSFSQMHSYYPVSVTLRDWMYFEIYGSISSNIVLLIDQCYSTPTMDRNHYLKYVFINNRCPTDNTVSFHSTVSSRQRFSIQAFRFLNSSTAVYIHCLVFLCHTSSSDYRCRSGCQGNNIYRGKREVKTSEDEPSQYYLLDMEVRKSEAGDGAKSDTVKGAGTLATVGMVVGFVACACIMVGLAIKVRALKKSASVTPQVDQEKRGKQYAEMDENQPPAQVPKEWVPIQNPEVIGDDLIMSKAKQADIFA